MSSNPCPKFSRRCPVTRIRRRAGSRKSRPRAASAAKAGVVLEPGGDRQQRVDDGVAGDEDRVRVDVLAKEVAARLGGRGVVTLGERADDPAVAFLGPRGEEVPGAKARLDVRDGNAVVVGRERGRRGRVRVAVHQHAIGQPPGERAGEPSHDGAGDVDETLPRAHDVEVHVGLEVEQRERLGEHLAVLAGRAEARLDPRGRGEALHQRRHLDRLGTGAADQQQADRWTHRQASRSALARTRG